MELIVQHQNQQQLTSHLWSAVRARGCQFLGPAMQEEVLKLVLLALETGSALSRKVLVMFIVQKLKPQYPQVSFDLLLLRHLTSCKSNCVVA